MYFQVENTPEYIRKARRTETIPKSLHREDCPRLVLAPFNRPPQVLFEDVLIGSTSERSLEIYNPSKQTQQITLADSLLPGLLIQLPAKWIQLEPETCYIVKLMWTPTQPTATREILRFTNENRRRFDVIVILKCVMNIKKKGNQSKVFKLSPGKIKKKTGNKSPVILYKKKSEIIYDTTRLIKTYNKQSHLKDSQLSNKENDSVSDYPIASYSDKCPFDSLSSVDLKFDTTEIFSNIRKPNDLQQTFDKSSISNNVPQNVLKPSNKQQCESVSDLFDNLTFTPFKTTSSAMEKLKVGPKIILSVNSESDFDDSLNMEFGGNKENETHPIVCVTSLKSPNKWTTTNHHAQLDYLVETPAILAKKHPNTSSPKEFNSPNFSINTEFSRISDLSFHPQRFSTEQKCFPKINNETQELLDDAVKLNSDTYTKDSPITPLEPNCNRMYDLRLPHYFMKDQPKMCRQALFKENYFQRDAMDPRYNLHEHNVWQNDLRSDIRSPPRSITPPLQSIPEESTQFSDTQVLNKTDRFKNTFTIDQTFDKTSDNFTNAHTQSWSKKAVRVQPDLWKIPITHIKKAMKNKPLKGKDSIGGKTSNRTFEINKSRVQNVTINHIGNVYSQSTTIDPFISSTYFYDAEAVEKFEMEFKRWLNCILTPPADLDSNIDQNIDVGKAWIENRNKDVPIAPTKEQVSSAYHNSHRLEKVRRSARTLFTNPETIQVFHKLTMQIDKKLIAIRSDRNLHLDVGLQKIIMELILSYNPLWLRIGLETIYGIVLPLKSNSDIEGLTTFIIQRMFKNPFLRNKHSQTKTPNMLLPAYIEAIKKFTLKKFFMLVYFLDQAKQRKLISHDPCLFCRNAVCKESREIIIRFTREVIAGIGDITKHLRPLGYIVSHKQSYLDEYKYAVHNIAIDIRDGVRLTKVMEIILMKDGLLGQLRTPAISRLQKIHNVQVALNALREANFVIHGDITASDIADGHREKTLSLLWQIIHVFRAPLFEKAANIIKSWWRKKYEVIVKKKLEAERILQERNNAASLIQCWWRRIQYNRLVEWKMQQITTAVVVLQKYCRMWICRTQLLKWKKNALKIEEWYKSIKMMQDAKVTLKRLKLEKEILKYKAATIIQSYVRRWLSMKMYALRLRKIVFIQSLIRRFLARRKYVQLRQAVIFVQRHYKGKLHRRREMQNFIKQRKYAILIQSRYRMVKQRKEYLRMKNSVQIIEERYRSLKLMRLQRLAYLKIKQRVIKIQTLFRRYRCVNKYLRQRELIVVLQRMIRGYQLMKKQKDDFLKIKNATATLQKYVKSYLIMKRVRQEYITLRKSTILIQKYFRSCLLAKHQRKEFIRLKKASIFLQKSYRSRTLTRKERAAFLELKRCAIIVQRRYRAQVIMKKHREEYKKHKEAICTIQRRFRAQINMWIQKTIYLKFKSSCLKIQRAYRALVLGRRQRQDFLQMKLAACKIQAWFRNCKKSKEIRHQFQQSKLACITIQRVYKARIIGRLQRQEYIRVRIATVIIQKFYRSYLEMRTVRQYYLKLRTTTVFIQRYYRSYLEMKEQRKSYIKMKDAVLLLGAYYKRYKEKRVIRQRYCQLRKASICIQRWYRSVNLMKMEREKFLKVKKSIIFIQEKYRALLAMRIVMKSYLQLQKATIIIQTRYRAYKLMKQTRINYIIKLRACRSIQRYYRAYIAGKRQKAEYLKLKESTIVLQRRFKALVSMRRERRVYLSTKTAAITIQRRYRSHRLMLKEQQTFILMVNSCIKIQRAFRAYVCGKRERQQFNKIKTAAIVIQRQFRHLRETRKIFIEYQNLRNAVFLVQRRYRANKASQAIKLNKAARTIQAWYRSITERNLCRNEYLKLRKIVIFTQSIVRMKIAHRRYISIKAATLLIQKCYRNYKLMKVEKQEYLRTRFAIVKLQSYVKSFIARKRFLKLRCAVIAMQTAYRFKKEMKLKKQLERSAAICLQKNVRRYIVRSRYLLYLQKVTYIQRAWRGKLVTRFIRCQFLQKRAIIIKFQSIIRGYLVRKHIQKKREHIKKIMEQKKLHWAASKIQALCRGHMARISIAHNKRVAELRIRWYNGGLKSTQETMKERHEEAMEVLRNISGIETVIKAFRSLELLTEVFPMMYNDNASAIVHRVYLYMSGTNRSISNVELLKYAVAVLVNLTRYRVTGPQIYMRDRIQPILRFMWRYSNSETQLFCIMATYLWLFSKYENIKTDLIELLNIPENHKMLVTIKGNVDRTKRMTTNILKNKTYTPRPSKTMPRTNNQSLNHTICTGNSNIILPALEPDYGIVRMDRPRYFMDAQQAINCLFHTYNL